MQVGAEPGPSGVRATHLLFDPVELLERLAALTLRPRINLVLYHGVLGAHAAWRTRITPGEAIEPDAKASNQSWATLMQRTFGFDMLACPQCGGRLRLIALIDAPPVIERILGHLGLRTAVPAARPSRAPPILEPVETGVRVHDDLAIP